MVKKLKFDEIGDWSILKLEILKKYAKAYTTIMRAQANPPLHYVYADAFAGAGKHIRKHTGEAVTGSPLNALDIDPPFKEYFFIDLNETKVSHLRKEVGARDDAHIYEGDCNDILLKEVFPRIRYRDYKRGLCLLDPYGLHLDWTVIAKAGEMKSVEIFLNFPVADINRNVLWHNPDGVAADDLKRMTAFWGDESWRKVAYVEAPQGNLFGEQEIEKTENETIAQAFRQRLQKIAGFEYVPAPLAMRNDSNTIVYYLFFASQNSKGGHIIEEIFESYRKRKG